MYMVSGIYSFGFSVALTGLARPLNGSTTYIPIPDGLFPFEVLLFAFFGLAFLVASFYQFRMSIRPASERHPSYGSPPVAQ
ncbi:MAG: hypothetical protein ABSB29_09700 [Nitrososphaerales archaeon]|jgi:hypothetical protein